jgi:hypothetical protein
MLLAEADSFDTMNACFHITRFRYERMEQGVAAGNNLAITRRRGAKQIVLAIFRQFSTICLEAHKKRREWRKR